jgi:hypothetical protein
MWKSESRMQPRRRKFASFLCNVERIWSEKEFDDVFGLLPWEETLEGELDFGVEFDVGEMLKKEVKVMERTYEGDDVGGIWMHLEVRSEDEEMGFVRIWMIKNGLLRKQVGYGEVINAPRMYVVKKAWKAIRVDVVHG